MAAAVKDRIVHHGRLVQFRGESYRVRRRDACRISALDEQRERGKCIFGGGLLLSRATAAERAAAERWHLVSANLKMTTFANVSRRMR